MITNTFRSKLSVLSLLAATASASCIIPGQYRVYRVAATTTSTTPDCGMMGDPGDSTTFKSGMTFAIYAADTETYYLDLEAESVEGKRSGSKYTFEGETVDVTDGGGFTLRALRNLEVKAEIKTRKISGTWIEENSTSCTGMGCPAATSCIVTVKFEGSEMKDVELEHPV